MSVTLRPFRPVPTTTAGRRVVVVASLGAASSRQRPRPHFCHRNVATEPRPTTPRRRHSRCSPHAHSRCSAQAVTEASGAAIPSLLPQAFRCPHSSCSRPPSRASLLPYPREWVVEARRSCNEAANVKGTCLYPVAVAVVGWSSSPLVAARRCGSSSPLVAASSRGLHKCIHIGIHTSIHIGIHKEVSTQATSAGRRVSSVPASILTSPPGRQRLRQRGCGCSDGEGAWGCS